MTDLDPISAPLPEPPPETAKEPFWDYHDLILFITAAIPSLLVSALAVRSIRSLLPEYAANKALSALVIQFVAYGIWFGSLYALLRLRYSRPFWYSLGWRGPKRGIALALFAGPFLAFAIGIIGLLLEPAQVDNPFKEFLRDRTSIVFFGLFATIIGPICEELAFRGFLQPLLSRTFGAAAGIVLANTPFALMHGPEYGWSWQHVVLVGSAGVAFCAVRHLTGSTAAAAGMHATYNLTWFTASVLQRGNQFSQW